jgi:aldehyde dehydrogenase (NAD+)
MKQRREELAMIHSQTMGCPLHIAQIIQVDGPIVGFESFSKRASLMEIEEQVNNSVVVKEAVGVCAMINPWNYPLHQFAGKVAPALAAGCTMVVKPSEETPVQDFIMAEIFDEVGLPAGVFNLVPGPGRVVGAAMSSHPDVDMVSFTGSTGAGIRISESAAPSVKRVALELGGKSPIILTEDCDLQAAAAYAAVNITCNTGQTCTALTRMLAPESRYEEIVQLVKQEFEKVTVGSPMDQSTDMGPMCSANQLSTVRDYIEKGISEGARLVTGGSDTPEGFHQGYYVKPTVFADVTNDMTIAQEEIFGPVLCIIPYQDIDHAVEIANDTVFGLNSHVWARTKEEGMAICRRIRAGLSYVNDGDFNYEAPFGGYKQSGNGREWGDHGLSEYVEVKSIQL